MMVEVVLYGGSGATICTAGFRWNGCGKPTAHPLHCGKADIFFPMTAALVDSLVSRQIADFYGVP